VHLAIIAFRISNFYGILKDEGQPCFSIFFSLLPSTFKWMKVFSEMKLLTFPKYKKTKILGEILIKRGGDEVFDKMSETLCLDFYNQ